MGVSTDSARAFRAAIESDDLDAIPALFAPDIVFHSPVTFHPFVGREDVCHLLSIVAGTFENFRYTDELEGDGTLALIFRAEVADRELEGIDLLRVNDDGLIADFTVMIRPMSGLVPFAERMAQQAQEAGLQTVRS